MATVSSSSRLFQPRPSVQPFVDATNTVPASSAHSNPPRTPGKQLRSAIIGTSSVSNAASSRLVGALQPPSSVDLESDLQSVLNDTVQMSTALCSAIESWVQTRNKEHIEKKSTHLQESLDIKETASQLQSQLEECNTQRADITRNMELEKRDYDRQVESSKSAQKQLATATERQKEAAHKIALLKSKIEQQKLALREIRKRKEAEHQKYEPQLEAYESFLHLKIHTLQQDRISFVFTHINESNWDYPFSFVVDINDRMFSVSECQPNIPSLPAIVKWLNETRDFYAFLKVMRKAFVEYNKAANDAKKPS
ncbi:chromosome segregation protein Spc25-domain-containing protein [Polychytrium aggregatum]|uniref:chromosome segregation protein Spc25-domain-containing protein n=1 Tax=Polychytrium aggregatum TaxID=110093 RepID=UPI0022FEB6E4|nr:chromosome segregation protein Spc25-domain-containing protein [Polychytrium aggregatum]KAI9201923.1 chromosome segregation protein Spc25-domain-containing protein [Polychytrium aggregatum]